MSLMEKQSIYFTNMLMLRDMVRKKLVSDKEANFVSRELAKDYQQEPVFLW